MATITIQAVSTKTQGRFNAMTTGIRPTVSDWLASTIDTPGSGLVSAYWTLGNICRDAPESCNLEIRDEETADVKATAERLGAD